MRKEYDFSKMKSRKNPYAKALKKQVTLRLGVDVIEYFKKMATETGIPYQNLVNLYLRECAV
ncbi:MAG: CopG family antitoxin, partial [Sedimentisphaerales bacterium]|nr:CopG family antitoxin [Sedimentisphaerales bacterium]